MSFPTNLLLVGASVRTAAQSAARSNQFANVLAADLFADRDTCEVVAQAIQVQDYPHDFLEIARRCSLRYGNLAVVYTGALENQTDLLEKIAEVATLCGNSSQVIGQVRDPQLLQQTLEPTPFIFPRTVRELPDDDDTQWLRKRYRSAGGQHVRRVEEVNPAATDDHFFQEYLGGTPCSASYLSNGTDCLLLGVTEMLVGTEWLGAGEFNYCGSLTCKLDQKQSDKWRSLGRLICEEFGLVGAFGIDAICGDEIAVLEVNPRFTASMELFDSNAFSVVEHHVRACHLERDLPPADLPLAPQARESFFGKYVLYAKQRVQFPEDCSQLRFREVGLADIPQPQLIESGYPILTLVAHASSRSSLIAKLQSASEWVYKRLSVDEATF